MSDARITETWNGKHDALTHAIIKVFYAVYNELGYGFMESVYKECMRLALTEAGFHVETEVPVPVHFRQHLVGVFKADLIVNNLVLIELKVCEALHKDHDAQTLHYLRATNIEVALLMNFGPSPRFRRFAMDNENKSNKSVQSAKIGVKPSPGAATNL
jgi:GxxExxY protein